MSKGLPRVSQLTVTSSTNRAKREESLLNRGAAATFPLPTFSSWGRLLLIHISTIKGRSHDEIVFVGRQSRPAAAPVEMEFQPTHITAERVRLCRCVVGQRAEFGAARRTKPRHQSTSPEVHRRSRRHACVRTIRNVASTVLKTTSSARHIRDCAKAATVPRVSGGMRSINASGPSS